MWSPDSTHRKGGIPLSELGLVAKLEGFHIRGVSWVARERRDVSGEAALKVLASAEIPMSKTRYWELAAHDYSRVANGLGLNLYEEGLEGTLSIQYGVRLPLDSEEIVSGRLMQSGWRVAYDWMRLSWGREPSLGPFSYLAGMSDSGVVDTWLAPSLWGSRGAVRYLGRRYRRCGFYPIDDESFAALSGYPLPLGSASRRWFIQISKECA